MMNITAINALSTLIDNFGDIAEHAPWVAQEAANFRPFKNRNAMIEAFQAVIKAAGKNRQLELVRAHPDLAGKAKLTQDSAKEQQGAGLDTLDQQELDRFTQLNNAYKSRFGFPFIFAVEGADKFAILQSFENRIENSRDEEFATAIAMVCQIVSFRLQDRVAA